MDLQIDFGSFTPHTAATVEPLFASVPGRAASLGNGEVLFLSTADQSRHVMTAQVLQALDLCREFQPMARHVERIEAAVPQLRGQRAAIAKVCEHLRSRGLLQSDEAFIARFARSAHAAPDPGPARAVFVRACERPAQLARLLDGLGALPAGRPLPPVVVIDDSRSSDALREHARLVDGLAEAGRAATHLDPGRWSAIVRRLQQELPDQAEAIGRMLDRDASGRVRGGGTAMNLAALLGAGAVFHQLDDDFSLPLRRHPEYRPGMQLHGASAERPLTFASREEAMAAGGEDVADPFGLHGAIVGRSLAELHASGGPCRLERAALRGLAPSRLPHLDPQRRVLATVNGHRGSTGSGRLGWLYLLGDRAKAGLCRDRETYLAGLADPGVWFGSDRYAVQTMGNFTPFSLDGRVMLAPTIPGPRGEDVLAAALMHLMHPRGLVMNLPVAIGHEPEATRDRSHTLAEPDLPTSAHCLSELARDLAASLHGDDPGLRLMLFADHLRDLAAQDEVALARYLREYLDYRRSMFIERLQANLEASKEKPVYWASDLRQQVTVNARALVDEIVPAFAGWPEGLDAAGCARHFRGELEALADAASAWPAMWQAARDLAPSLLAPG